MKRSKPFYVFGIFIVCIIFVIGSILLFSGFTKEKRDEAEKKMIESVLDSVDWENFPWESFPFEDLQNFPWENMPWESVPFEKLPEDFPWEKIPPDSLPWEDLPENFPWETYPWQDLPEDFDWNQVPWEDIPEDFDWNKVPWDNIPEDFDWDQIPFERLPENFPWDKVPLDKLPEDFDWNNMPWESLPEDFEWNNVPWENMPEDFEWENLPWENLPSDFPFEKVPLDKLPEDFDWNRMPWESLPDDFDYNSVPWDSMPEDFDWNSVPWDKLPADFDYNSLPWDNMPEDFDWSRLPWDKLPADFPWDKVPWNDMPPEFWRDFPWESLPEGFPWWILPWLLIDPGLVPDGVFPDGFYPDEWICDHEFDSEWIVEPQPDCIHPGKRYNFCKKCKKLVTEDVPATGVHTYGNDNICEVCHIRRLVIESKSLRQPYDGKPTFATELYIVEGESAALIEGHRINSDAAVFLNSPVTGKQDNVFYFRGAEVVDGEGNNVSSNYEIIKRMGIIEITARELKITTHDKSKPYDGEKLSGSYDDLEIVGLADGDYIDQSTLIFTEIDEITSCDNAINTDFKILNADGEDVTACYKIAIEFGTLEITQPAAPQPAALYQLLTTVPYSPRRYY